METDYIIRQLKRTANKHRNDTLRTFDTNITAMCNDVIPKLELLMEYEKNGLTPEQIREIDKLYAEKCRELAGLKKNYGLPCKVGDSYILIFNDFGELFTTIGWELTEITIVEDDIILDFYCHETMEDEQRSINSFGKTMFKTKEEAEAKLAEMEGGHE